MLLLLSLYFAVLGLLVGSYLNVVAHRLPLGQSTVTPRSRCPACGAAIKAYDNIPLLSYLWLRGRCRGCGVSISWRYPLLEALTAGLFVACFLRFGLSRETLVALALTCLSIVLAAIDFDHFFLPDRLTLPGIALGIGAQAWLAPSGSKGAAALAALASAALGAAILLAVWAVWYLLFREEGMGLGDVKMLALLGAFLGWAQMLAALFLATLTGALFGLGWLLWRRLRYGPRQADERAMLPFGVFLAIGGLLALFFGREIVSAYASLL